jgi:hypothetical protein
MGMGWAAGAGRAAVCFGRRRAERVWVWVRVRVWVWVWVWVWAGEAMPASRVVWPCLKMVPWASVEGAEMAWLQRGWSGLVWQDGCNLVRLAVSAVWPSAGVCARRAVDQRRGVGGWRMADAWVRASAKARAIPVQCHLLLLCKRRRHAPSARLQAQRTRGGVGV